LLYKVSRFDIKGKQQLATLEKYYVPDLAIRYLLVGRRDFSDRGHLLENIVYLELLRRGGQIWVGKNTSSEIDSS
jgi:predicted AAA+ superfamily ATPase